MGDEGVEEAQICRKDCRRVGEVERGEKKDYGVFFLYHSTDVSLLSCISKMNLKKNKM